MTERTRTLKVRAWGDCAEQVVEQLPKLIEQLTATPAPVNPWDNEPDRKEWEAHGLKCVIIRQEWSGHLCGYVGLPQTHPLHGVDYDDPHPALVAALQRRMGEPLGNAGVIPLLVAACKDSDEERATMDVALDVHGGVTYTCDGLKGYEGKSLWWVGFDCNHCDDLAPYQDSVYRQSLGCTYRDMVYVTAQTENLARQLAELA